MPLNDLNPSDNASAGRPRCAPTAMAASAFRTLCSPEQRRLESTEQLVLSPHDELRASIPVPDILGSPGGVGLEAERLHRAHREAAERVRVRTIRAKQQQAVPWDQVHEPPEGEQHRIEIGVDVGMIELDVPDDRDVGEILEELGGLVEERAVVLVTLDHEVAALSDSIARALLPEIERDATNQQRRIERTAREQPCRQRRRRGLAMRASDDNRARIPEKVIAHSFRERAVTDLPLQDALELGVASRNRVPDHDEVDVRCDVLGSVSAERRDSLLDQEIAHRRIHILIGALDVVPSTLEQRRERGHGRAADADQMDPRGSLNGGVLDEKGRLGRVEDTH